MTDRRTIEEVRRHRDTMSVRELSRSLSIPKREVLDILKRLGREGAGSSPIPSRWTFFSRLRGLSDRFFDSRVAPSIALLVIALSLRLGFLAATYEDPLVQTPILDGAYYLEWGRGIADGTWVSDDAYFVEPGFAYLVALSIKIFSSFLPLIPLQLVLGSLAVVLTHLAAVRATGRRTASFLAALLAACSAPLVFHDALLLKTSVEFFLLSLSVYTLARAWDAPLARAFLPVGIALGLTAAVKANVFYAVPLIVGAIFLATVRAEYVTALRKAAFLVLGVVLVLSPIAIRNFVKSGSFVPINASGGPNLYIGNWEGADGSLKPPEFVSVNPESEETSWRRIAESYEHRILTLPEVSSFWTGETLRQIAGDPGFFLEITAKKVLLLFHHVPLADNADESYAHELFPPLRFLIPFWIPAILGLTGMAFALFSREKRRFFPYAAIAFGYAGTLAIGHVSERYRLSLLPVLLIFVAFLFAWITDWIAARKWTSLAVTSVAILFLAVLALLPVIASGTSPADMYANFGAKAEDRGDLEQARIFYERGLAADSLHIPSLQKLARLALLDSDLDRSIALSRTSILRQWELPGDLLALALDAKAKNLSREEIHTRLDVLDDDADDVSYDADYLEAMKRFRRQEYEESIPYFERALGRYPKSETVTANLATAYKNGGNPDQGEKLLRRVIERNPANLPARFNLGNYYMQKKDYFGAIREYGAINDLVPGYHLSRFYLGEAYAKAGDNARAIETYRTFIEESRDWPEKAGAARQAEQLISGLEKKRALPGAGQPTE